MIITSSTLRKSLHLFIVFGMLCSLTACGGRTAVRNDAEGNLYSAEDLYQKAKDSMRGGGFGRAIQLYEIMEVRFPFSEYTRQGQLDLMYAYYRHQRPESAIETANRFIREHPRHERVDYAYYVRGLAHFPEGLNVVEKVFRVSPYSRPQDQASKSFDAFSTLVQKYPDSQWAEDAQQRMVYLRNAMARYELEVAHYYIRRGAYIAAANRTKKVIEEFQESDAVLDALRLQIIAYNKLGLDDLAADTQRVLDQNITVPE